MGLPPPHPPCLSPMRPVYAASGIAGLRPQAARCACPLHVRPAAACLRALPNLLSSARTRHVLLAHLCAVLPASCIPSLRCLSRNSPIYLACPSVARPFVPCRKYQKALHWLARFVNPFFFVFLVRQQYECCCTGYINRQYRLMWSKPSKH